MNRTAKMTQIIAELNGCRRLSSFVRAIYWLCGLDAATGKETRAIAKIAKYPGVKPNYHTN